MKCRQLNPKRPTVPQVIPLVKAYYEVPGNGVGGNLHIVLDDFNIKDYHIKYCLKQCKETGDSAGEELANMLMQMSPSQRRKVVTRT